MPIPLDLWNQFGGNPGGSGFRLVNSVDTTSSWHTELPADVGAGGPVFGPDGTIYLGTIDGKLVAIDLRGVIKWTVQIGALYSSVPTPAVAADGTIYCLCTSYVRDHRTPPVVRDHRTNPAPLLAPEPAPANFVVSVNPDGTIRWTVPIRVQGSSLGWDTGHVRGAPRIISMGSTARVIFVIRYNVPINYPEIGATGPLFISCVAIVDEHGTFRLFNRFEEYKLFVDAHGGGGFPSGATLGPASWPAIPRLPAGIEPCADTPVVFGSYPARQPWTIVASGSEGLYALHWSEEEGAVTGPAALISNVAAYPAPVAFPNGLLAAMSKGRVTLLETDTFTQWLPLSVDIEGDAMVAGGLRQMYFLERASGTLRAIDMNGTVWSSWELREDSVACPVVSANRVYVSTTTGILALRLDLSQLTSNGRGFPLEPPGGVAAMAVGPDGGFYYLHPAEGKTILFGCRIGL